ncbi:MAG: hypothetical protein GY819_02310 [Planctomycetaceae bacterium]|nr:hypothetical protein [Planctomycetaceae bacterium]MCP4461614.1 hypothetical protein [Planctomycetaceae bacterium]MDG1807697.1 hypothetical protein [Pirellulaceae bacterium]
MNDKNLTQRDSNDPASKMELAAWAIISEPLDSDAIARVKAKAKKLADSPTDTQTTQEQIIRDASIATPTLEAKQNVRRNRVQPSRQNRNYWIIRGAIAALVIVAVGTGLFFSSSQKSAFAAAIEKLRAIKAFSYEIVAHYKDPSLLTRSRIFVSEDGRMRMEMAGVISILDKTGATRLTLLADTNTAMVMEPMIRLPEIDYLAWFKELKSYQAEPDKILGQEQLNGQTIAGYEITLAGMRYHIWVNTKTQELAKIVIFHDGLWVFAFGGLERTEMLNFDFDVTVEDSLFSLEVPEGYEIFGDTGEAIQGSEDREAGIASENQELGIDTDILEAVKNPEQNIVEALRGYAELADGKFPASLTEWFPWIEVITSQDVPDSILTKRLGVMSTFLAGIKSDDYAYLGDGLMLNQTEKAIVFWYKTKDGDIKAIDSDLSIKSFDADEFPLPDD